MEFQCKHCSYRFEAEKRPFSCPYCGEKGGAVPTQNATELLAEVTKVESMREDMTQRR